MYRKTYDLTQVSGLVFKFSPERRESDTGSHQLSIKKYHKPTFPPETAIISGQKKAEEVRTAECGNRRQKSGVRR